VAAGGRAAAPSPLRHALRVASYNVDGLCERHVAGRARAAAAALAALAPPPDVVMLQEVTEENEAVFQAFAAARGMRMLSGAPVCGAYFAALLVSQRLGDIRLRVTPFPTSRMGRHVFHTNAAAFALHAPLCLDRARQRRTVPHRDPLRPVAAAGPHTLRRAAPRWAAVLRRSRQAGSRL